VPEAKLGALEHYQLTAEGSESLEELRELSKKAEAGEKGARTQLRRAVARSSPKVIAEASDIAQRVQAMLTKTISAGEPLMEEALEARLALMREEVAGENPTPLEVLLTERVVAGWLLVEVLEGLIAAQFYKRAPKSSRVPPSYTLQMSRILESATRRYLSAIRELARVRKLQAGAPPVQVNAQVNILRG
jgi:hypothetical protein